jgi:hypothetical protein
LDRLNPLWLPLGSIRSIIALTFSAAGIIAMFTLSSVPEWFALLLGVVIRDYFAVRAESQPRPPVDPKVEYTYSGT